MGKTTLFSIRKLHILDLFLGLQNSVQIVFGPLECSIEEIFELDGACAARCLCIGMVTVYEMGKIVVDDPEPIERNIVV